MRSCAKPTAFSSWIYDAGFKETKNTSQIKSIITFNSDEGDGSPGRHKDEWGKTVKEVWDEFVIDSDRLTKGKV